MKHFLQNFLLAFSQHWRIVSLASAATSIRLMRPMRRPFSFFERLSSPFQHLCCRPFSWNHANGLGQSKKRGRERTTIFLLVWRTLRESSHALHHFQQNLHVPSSSPTKSHLLFFFPNQLSLPLSKKINLLLPRLAFSAFETDRFWPGRKSHRPISSARAGWRELSHPNAIWAQLPNRQFLL